MSRDYCAVSAKLKAMYGRRLKREDFEALLLKKSVPEICAALKKTEAYGEAFADTDEQQAHRGEVEKVLEQCFYEEYERLYSFVDAKKRELLRLWLVRRETDVLSEALRHISNAESTEQRKVSEFFVRHTGIDTDALCKAKSLAEAAAACKNTRYYDVLNRADRAGSEFFSIAMTLDRDYFVLAKKAAQKYLDGEEQKIFSELYEDTAELLWYLAEHDMERCDEIERYSVEYQPCFLLAADREIVSAVVRLDGAYKNAFLEAALKRADAMRRSARMFHYFTEEGLDAFIENGILTEYPETYLRPLTETERVLVLDRFLEIAKQENITIGIIRPDHLHLKRSINVYLSSACGLNMILYDEKQGLRNMIVEEHSIYHAFKTFILRMEEKRDVLSHEETEAVLKEKREKLWRQMELKK